MPRPPSHNPRMMSLYRTTLAIAITCLFGSALLIDRPAHAQRLSWPDKSGPTFDGHVVAEDAKGLPTEWDEATGRNIAWKIKLEGHGHSTPVIGGGRVW